MLDDKSLVLLLDNFAHFAHLMEKQLDFVHNRLEDTHIVITDLHQILNHPIVILNNKGQRLHL